MKIFGIAGWSGSGKTTLLLRLIPQLVARGVEVATIKHSHHALALGDAETRALAAAGAAETMVASVSRWALVRELPADVEPPGLEDLAPAVRGADLVLVEGFKSADHPKLEVHDPALGKPLLAPADPTVVALACDVPLAGAALPRFRRDDAAGVAEFILAHCGLGARI